MVYFSGPMKIWNQIQFIGSGIFIALIPYCFVVLFDALAWKYLIISNTATFNLYNIFATKIAGDFINNVTPAGSIAGEPVKAHILKRFGVDFMDGMASVYMGKLLMAKGQVIFIFIGIFISFTLLYQNNKELLVYSIVFMAVLLSVLLMLYFISLQKGLFNTLLSMLNKFKLRFNFLEKQREKLNLFDEKVSHFFNNHKKKFTFSLLFYTLGWIMSAVELFVGLTLLGAKISFYEALMIESIISVIKAITFFVPGNWGTQEGGYVFLLRIINIPEAMQYAISYSILRRFRELLWLGTGMFFLSKFNIELSKIKNLEQPIK